MDCSDNQISEQFAKQLLKSLSKLDVPIGSLDLVISKIQDDQDKEIMSKAIGEIMFITLTELMAPIYQYHPTLGRASEPGAWILENEDE